MNYLGMEGEYDKLLVQGKRLFLGVTVGRSGTWWHAQIFSEHKNAIGSCERYNFAEAFYRYIMWNKLQVDVQGFINLLKDSIVQDWKNHDISFITSPYFSNDVLFLYNVLKPEIIIWAVNDPKFTITSFYNKGWYSKENIKANDSLINGIQPSLVSIHNFSRLVPIGKEYHEWKKLTRIGKIAWFYNIINIEIFNNLNEIPKEKVFVFKLEEADQNYEYYLRYAHKFGLKGILSKKKFLSIKKKSRYKKSDNIQTEWSEKENDEFKEKVNEFYRIYKNL